MTAEEVGAGQVVHYDVTGQGQIYGVTASVQGQEPIIKLYIIHYKHYLAIILTLFGALELTGTR